MVGKQEPFEPGGSPSEFTELIRELRREIVELRSEVDSLRISKKQTAAAPAAAPGGLGLGELLSLTREAEDRATKNFASILQIAMSSQTSTHKAFMEGMSLARELSAADTDGDGELDGMSYLSPLVELAKEILSARKSNPAERAFVKGLENGIPENHAPEPSGKVIRDALGNGSQD